MGEIKPGDKVTYVSRHSGEREQGMVKSIHVLEKLAFVVYKCNEDWENYRDYTGQSTELDDLEKGWATDEPEQTEI